MRTILILTISLFLIFAVATAWAGTDTRIPALDRVEAQITEGEVVTVMLVGNTYEESQIENNGLAHIEMMLTDYGDAVFTTDLGQYVADKTGFVTAGDKAAKVEAQIMPGIAIYRSDLYVVDTYTVAAKTRGSPHGTASRSHSEVKDG